MEHVGFNIASLPCDSVTFLPRGQLELSCIAVILQVLPDNLQWLSIDVHGVIHLVKLRPHLSLAPLQLATRLAYCHHLDVCLNPPARSLDSELAFACPRHLLIFFTINPCLPELLNEGVIVIIDCSK